MIQQNVDLKWGNFLTITSLTRPPNQREVLSKCSLHSWSLEYLNMYTLCILYDRIWRLTISKVFRYSAHRHLLALHQT